MPPMFAGMGSNSAPTIELVGPPNMELKSGSAIAVGALDWAMGLVVFTP